MLDINEEKLNESVLQNKHLVSGPTEVLTIILNFLLGFDKVLNEELLLIFLLKYSLFLSFSFYLLKHLAGRLKSILVLNCLVPKIYYFYYK